jgi:GNAT superfamily N-acetyltransferase
MGSDAIVYREASADDLPGISRVRFAVVENASTAERLRERGITEASVAASFLTTSKGWVAIYEGEIVGFSIADRDESTVFALFVLPDFEGRGIGGRLFDFALAWLWASGASRLWLATGPNTRAARFYERRGWMPVGEAGYDDIRYEISRPN